MLHYLGICNSSAYTIIVSCIVYESCGYITATLRARNSIVRFYFFYFIVPLLILETTDDSTNLLILFLGDKPHRDHHRVLSIPAIYNYFKAARILAERVHVQCKRCVVDMYSVEV